MHIIPFILWIIGFSLILGVIDALKTSKKNITAPRFFQKNIKFYKQCKKFLIFILALISFFISVPFIHGIVLAFTAPLLFYYLYEGAYYEARGQNDVPSWNWSTNASSIYTNIVPIKYKTRLYMFLFGLTIIFTTIITVG